MVSLAYTLLVKKTAVEYNVCIDWQEGELMKQIKCVIQPYKLDEVMSVLAGIPVQGMTVSEVKGFGRQKGHTELYGGAEYTVDFVPKMEVEVVVSDAMAETVVDAMIRMVRTGRVGDGKIFIQHVAEAVRIRTSEYNDAAL